jgi:uncharacterized protein
VADETFVEVTGHGSAVTTHDRVRIWLAAEAESAEVAEAFQASEAALQSMLAALRDEGIESEHLRTTHVDVESEHTRRGQSARFSASMGLEVLLDDVASAGRVLTAAIAAGGNASRVRGISLTTVAVEEALAEARDAAWAGALSKARQYAVLAGRDLGEVMRVSELPRGSGGGDAVPMAAMGASSGFIEPGSQTVRVVVTVRWRLL